MRRRTARRTATPPPGTSPAPEARAPETAGPTRGHEALTRLLRLLARQAAAEMFAASAIKPDPKEIHDEPA